MKNNLLKIVPGIGDASRALENLTGAWKEYKVTSEVEQTKRESIRAIRDSNVKAIEENSAILKIYLEGVFKERAGVIEGMFRQLDKGLAEGNSQFASEALAAIVAVTKQSPLAGARDILNGINNPDVKCIEI
jgi:hypothetical protein